MELFSTVTPAALTEKAKKLYREERESHKVLNGWFLSKEIAADADETMTETCPELRAAAELEAIVEKLPIEISDNAILAGSQRDAFAASYALINPAFKVETFRGYCDPLEVYDYATPTEEVSAERIAAMRARYAKTPYVKALNKVYGEYGEYTDEVAFFIEQVTGHMIPDFRPALKNGVKALINGIDGKIAAGGLSEKQVNNLTAMKRGLRCAVKLAHRYADLAQSRMETAAPQRRAELELMVRTLRKVPEYGAENLQEAMQSYVLLWQVMCIEQAPNPFAFSVGNADRIFEPYRAKDNLSREEAAALFKHFLVFYNVGERSWAISQNVLISGRDVAGNDLTNEMSYAILDAYYDMNLPQPILSVKLHKATPRKLYEELGRFFFTPGALTPSLFNDDSLFQTLRESGVDEADLPDYSVAGCQEPLIMGKDNANTTNSWLNLPKVLELTLTGGKSAITGTPIGPQSWHDAKYILENLRPLFYENLQFFCEKMRSAANGASRALSLLPVPFLSCFEGGLETGYDVRDTENQGTKYNGSGCLIHGLSVIADSFIAVDHLLKERPEDAENLIAACKCNFEGYEELHGYLKSCPKYGNNIPEVDKEAAEIANRVSDMVAGLKNYLGNPFRPDWSSPSTHLTYGYWVGATPDGRGAREQMNYGIDPLFSTADSGLGFRTLSTMQLPFCKMNGGCASHFGIDPKYFTAETYEEKGVQFYDRVLKPLFFNPGNPNRAPFYLYVNVTTAQTLRKVLANPAKYAPGGVYIMRIHGTFVNFLDLSPAIQEDIILRLDPNSTCC
ncbi:MAG: hypothetical protein J6L24_03420 [Oscillospiraceae bacterium]|nr:hypothetical protein [Oscillospiraceae bacterium]